jgi:fructose-specific phosphotransferase system component IIB
MGVGGTEEGLSVVSEREVVVMFVTADVEIKEGKFSEGHKMYKM